MALARWQLTVSTVPNAPCRNAAKAEVWHIRTSQPRCGECCSPTTCGLEATGKERNLRDARSVPTYWLASKARSCPKAGVRLTMHMRQAGAPPCLAKVCPDPARRTSRCRLTSAQRLPREAAHDGCEEVDDVAHNATVTTACGRTWSSKALSQHASESSIYCWSSLRNCRCDLHLAFLVGDSWFVDSSCQDNAQTS